MLHTCEWRRKEVREMVKNKNLMPKSRDNEKHDDKLILKIYGINHTARDEKMKNFLSPAEIRRNSTRYDDKY
jgi:hypothetical protein